MGCTFGAKTHAPHRKSPGWFSFLRGQTKNTASPLHHLPPPPPPARTFAFFPPLSRIPPAFVGRFRRLYGPKAWDESACLKAEDGSGRRSGGASSAVPRVLCLARVVEVRVFLFFFFLGGQSDAYARGGVCFVSETRDCQGMGVLQCSRQSCFSVVVFSFCSFLVGLQQTVSCLLRPLLLCVLREWRRAFCSS